MSEPPKSDHLRSALIQALAQAEIPNKKDRTASRLFSQVCWDETPNGEIELLFSTWHFRCGRLHCAIQISELAQGVVEILPDNDLIDALVDTLEYYKCVVFTLLPVTQHQLLKRGYNIRVKSIPRSDDLSRKGLLALFEMMQAAYVDSRAVREKRLANEPKTRRGGSDPRLPKNEMESLHAQYSGLHQIAQQVKKDYNATLRRFAKSRGAKGYSHQEWRDFWRNYVVENYPSELLEDFVELFSRQDNPSASEVAYFKLAKHTGHKKSYLPRLVTASRRAAKKTDNETA